MSTLEDITRQYQQYRDEVWLAASIIIILISGIIIGRMVVQAFDGYSGLRESFRSIINFIQIIDLVNIISVVIGFYLGLLALLFIDFKKRIQSTILLIGTLVSFVLIWMDGVMFTAMGPVDWTLVIVVGVTTIYMIGGQTLRNMSFNPDDIYRNRVLTTENDRPVEFPKAARYLWILLAAFIVVAFHEAYTQYPEFLIWEGGYIRVDPIALFTGYEIVGSENAIARDILASFFFLGSFLIFLRYDASSEIVFIGPPRSGKTHLIIGLFSEAQNLNYNPRNVSPYITEQKDYITVRQTWADPTEGEVHDMKFSFTTPGIFSKNILINGLDYPGEYSYFIPEGLELAADGMKIPKEPIDQTPPVEFGGPPIGQQLADQGDNLNPKWEHLVDNHGDGYETEYQNAIGDVQARRSDGTGDAQPDRTYVYMVNSVLPRVRDADAIGFLFDTSEHLRWERDEGTRFAQLGYYQHIMDVSRASRSIGIATKTDELKEEFVDERHIEPDSNYEEFREYVNDRLLGGPYSGELQGLQLHPYPVYIENRDTGRSDQEGPKVPLRTFGMEELLQELGE